MISRSLAKTYKLKLIMVCEVLGVWRVEIATVGPIVQNFVPAKF